MFGEKEHEAKRLEYAKGLDVKKDAEILRDLGAVISSFKMSLMSMFGTETDAILVEKIGLRKLADDPEAAIWRIAMLPVPPPAGGDFNLARRVVYRRLEAAGLLPLDESK
ncbi:hypothetical protein HZA39_00350 [Candidatus Peregrinibacteria bacterium]|nr:hypothetical protein [Candidatus Peregrinibacteria bacterium]